MKKNMLQIGAAALLLLAIAAPAGAQYYGFPRTEEWNRFLARHHGVAGQLNSDPCLMGRPGWRQNHPELHEFLLRHPGEANQLKARARRYCRGYGGPGYGGWGDYDEHHQWHDYDWWQDHNPGWARAHHPEWWEGNGPFAPHPGWGDYDEHHEWHDADWWRDHHPGWARQHHPEWAGSVPPGLAKKPMMMPPGQAKKLEPMHFGNPGMPMSKEERHAEHRAVKEQRREEHRSEHQNKHDKH